MKSISLILVILASAAVHAQDMFGDDKRTFVLHPAEAVSSGIVTSAEFSSSGRFLIYRRADKSQYDQTLTNPDFIPNSQWYRYDRTTKTNMRLTIPDGAQDVIAMGDDQNIFFAVREENAPIGFLNVKSGAVTPIKFPLGSVSYFGDLDFAPFLVVKSGERGATLIRPNGQTLTFQLPPKVRLMSPMSADSLAMTFSATIQGGVGGSRFARLTYKMSDGSTSLAELSRETLMKELAGHERNQDFWFEDIGDLAYVKLMKLPKGLKTDLPTKAKLGTAKSFAQFSPTGDSVAYLDAGALLIRDIKPIDSALARKLALNSAKEKAMKDAKQAALGLLMCASDMDDVFPGQEGWESKVNPYCLDPDLLKNFNYTFKGGNISGIESPATTEMGFTVGPGGRAVAYVDGHVKWIPNP